MDVASCVCVCVIMCVNISINTHDQEKLEIPFYTEITEPDKVYCISYRNLRNYCTTKTSSKLFSNILPTKLSSSSSLPMADCYSPRYFRCGTMHTRALKPGHIQGL